MHATGRLVLKITAAGKKGLPYVLTDLQRSIPHIQNDQLGTIYDDEFGHQVLKLVHNSNLLVNNMYFLYFLFFVQPV